jgi:hypothetical protein
MTFGSLQFIQEKGRIIVLLSIIKTQEPKFMQMVKDPVVAPRIANPGEWFHMFAGHLNPIRLGKRSSQPFRELRITRCSSDYWHPQKQRDVTLSPGMDI